MSTKQITGIVLALILVGALFLLPKVVVENEERQETAVAQTPVAINSEASGEETHDDHDGHDHGPGMHEAELSLQEQQTALRLSEKLKKSESKEKSAIFADSLSALYARAQKFDSAAWYAEKALENDRTFERLASAGSYYAEAFKFAVNPERQKGFGNKAEEYLQEVLRKDPKRHDAKNKLAMVFVSSATPMKGIQMLQEVLKEDPDNTEALYNMGILSVQSGQYEKSAERFEKYTSLVPGNAQAQFYLAYSYLQLGRKADAKKVFLKVKELDKDPEVQATVDEYLKEL